MNLPNWVIEAARLPVAFAQVREDALLDQWVVEQLGRDVRILMVASGGCSAAVLAMMPQVARIHLVDPNPAQIALARLKLRLLLEAGPEERLALLGHAPMPADERSRRLASHLTALGLSRDAFGPAEFTATAGPDQVGRYEVLFSRLREALAEVSDEIEALLRLRDTAEQASRIHPSTPLGRSLDAAFDSVMALPILVELFGEGATRNRREPFACHFAGRTREALGTFPAADNPYLWQLLRGRFPDGSVYPWLTAAVSGRIPELAWTVTPLAEFLRSPGFEFDYIHLSNILDWLSPEEARATLDLVWKSLRPGGRTFIRQLNSTLDMESLGSQFEWDVKAAEELHRRDRSFFYCRLHLGKKG